MPLEASTVQDAVHPEHLVRFGTFEVDLEAGELRRNGLKLKLTGQPFQVLTILLEHPGRVVTREDLQKRLWPDTFVDVDHNLNTAINKIREVLGDLAESPRFVETLPRRGYRFIAPVTTASKERNGLMDSRGDGAPLPMIGPGDAPQVSSAPSGSRVHHHRLKNALVVVGLIFLTTVGSVVVLRTNHTPAPAQDENQASSTMQIVPVTTASGSARSPAFSPNGAWLAYIWDGPERKRDEVYVQLFGSDAPLRLTYSKKGRLGSPAWSPDGREIAFVRCDGEEDGVFVVPALGGAERRLTNGGCLAFPGPLAYLSDGKGLLMMDRCPAAEQSGLVLFSLMTGEKQCLAHPGPPNGFSQLWWFSLSPDGRTIAFTASESRATGTYNDIYVIPLSGGVPHRLTTDSHCFDEPLMWTPGGKSIVFFSERSTLRSLWRVPATGGEVQREVAYPAIGSFSADGHRLLYSEQADEEDPSIWRADLARPAGPVLKNAESIRTQYPEMDAQPYADGMRIVWVSRRTGFWELWMSDAAGGNPRQITHLNLFSGTPRWSPDGKWISFDLNTSHSSQIYVIDADGRRLRPITDGPSSNIRPSWSRDGNAIYFASNRTGRYEVWKHSLKGVAEVQLTRNGGFNPLESYDGRTIYYTKDYNGLKYDEAGIWSIPTSGGPDSLVVAGKPQLGCSGYWAITKDGLYFLNEDADPGPSIEFYGFGTRRTSHVLTLGKRPNRFEPGLSATADGKTIYYTQYDQQSAIKMMEISR